MVHGVSGGIISQDLLYIIGEDKQQSWINQIVLSASDPDARKSTSTLDIAPLHNSRIQNIEG